MESIMHRRLKSTLTVMNHFSIFAMVAPPLIGLSAIGLAKADEAVTPWGQPDLQGIWTDEFDTPLQRSAKYANQEFFTEAQRAELDQARSGILNRRATERDVNNGYNGGAFFSMKRPGAPPSRVADPPNGRFPALTPEAQKTAAAEREFRVALVQST